MAYGRSQPPMEYRLIFIGTWAGATYFPLSYSWRNYFTRE